MKGENSYSHHLDSDVSVVLLHFPSVDHLNNVYVTGCYEFNMTFLEFYIPG